jgi:hypothetical protein
MRRVDMHWLPGEQSRASWMNALENSGTPGFGSRGGQARADASAPLAMLVLGLLVSSCAVVHHVDLATPPLRPGESCAQWCVAVVATCTNRCQGDVQACQRKCDAQRADCLKSCDSGQQ